MRAPRLVPAAVLLLTSGAAHAALKLNYERKKADDPGKPGSSTIVVDADHIRMDGMGAGRGPDRGGTATIIVDAPGKRFLIVDAEKKVYREITEADAKQMKERMEGMKAQMAARLKNVPPEQRQRMEEAMGRMGGGKEGMEMKYQPLGTKKKISGFACEMYKVEMPMSSAEACIAPWSSNIVSKAEIAQWKKLAAELESTFQFAGGRMMSEWSKAPGIAVEMTHMGRDGKPEWTTTLKSISRGDVPASDFQPPAGFTKESTPMFGGPGGPRHGGGPGGPGAMP